jgi:hypothetical protein
VSISEKLSLPILSFFNLSRTSGNCKCDRSHDLIIHEQCTKATRNRGRGSEQAEEAGCADLKALMAIRNLELRARVVEGFWVVP